MYPEEHGAELALLWLTAFPNGTSFKKIDDIDQCLLLIADVRGSNQNPFSERHFHVAIWHEDLRELHRQGLINGVLGEREWTKIWLSSLPPGPLYMKLRGGTLQEVRLPSPEKIEDEDLSTLHISTRARRPVRASANCAQRSVSTSAETGSGNWSRRVLRSARRLQDLRSNRDTGSF